MKPFKYSYSLLFLFFVISSCVSFGVNQDEVVARVGNSYLYRSDLEKQMSRSLSFQDSIVKVRSIINEWARDILLYDLSRINLSEDRQMAIQSLVKDYELDVFSNAYQESLIQETLDTVVSKQEIEIFYESNKEIFRLNNSLYQFRFIRLPLDNVERFEIKKRFRLYTHDDRQFLDSLSFQFTEYFLNDSVWISKVDLFNKVGFINQDNVKKYIKKSQFFEVRDSLDVFLFYMNDFIEREAVAPLGYVETTIANILLNKRKIEFLKTFNKEIIEDAIKSKKLEIY